MIIHLHNLLKDMRAFSHEKKKHDCNYDMEGGRLSAKKCVSRY